MKFSFNTEDASQVCVGAFALAVPVAFSEEAWHLGETLPLLNIGMLFSLSLLFLGVFTYHSVFQQILLPAFLCLFFVSWWRICSLPSWFSSCCFASIKCPFLRTH